MGGVKFFFCFECLEDFRDSREVPIEEEVGIGGGGSEAFLDVRACGNGAVDSEDQRPIGSVFELFEACQKLVCVPAVEEFKKDDASARSTESEVGNDEDSTFCLEVRTFVKEFPAILIFAEGLLEHRDFGRDIRARREVADQS